VKGEKFLAVSKGLKGRWYTCRVSIYGTATKGGKTRGVTEKGRVPQDRPAEKTSQWHLWRNFGLSLERGWAWVWTPNGLRVDGKYELDSQLKK